MDSGPAVVRGLRRSGRYSEGKAVETADWITVGGIAAILAFLWNLHRDVADLRERMARLEGLFDGFTKREREAAP